MADTLPTYTWSPTIRQFRDGQGRFVSRPEVRGAVDAYLDEAQVEIGAACRELQAGAINVSEWELRMAAAIKRAHVATGAVAAGGKDQATAADWAAVGRRLKAEYGHLRDLGREIEDGLPLDGAFMARSLMYGRAATGSYEDVLQIGDEAAGFDEERKVRHSGNSCSECIEDEDAGWQPIGTVRRIGRCICKSNCMCTFERRRSVPLPRPRNRRFAMSQGVEFDREKCRRRNRLAARRDGLDAAPVRLYGSTAPAIPTAGGMLTTLGRLPVGPDEALARINLMLGRQARPLRSDQVYLHYAEAANDRFISDRYLFLHPTTLKNIARAGSAGIAFMNSHRTGGLSTPTELPFGRTFAGRYEEFDDGAGGVARRTLLGIYMLRGVQPNGAAGPSTDDLHAAIEGGTLFDVSMGLKAGGTAVCDVCGAELGARDAATGEFLCPHVPGTHRAMSSDAIEAQEARGVAGGKASYSLVDAIPGEVSAVFDGAVPGAGFSKAMAFGRSGGLAPEFAAEATASYATLLSATERDVFSPRKPTPAKEKGKAMDILKAFKFWQASGEPEELDLSAFASAETPTNPPPAPPKAPPKAPPVDLKETPEFKAALAAEVARQTREADDTRLAAAAEAWFSVELAASRAVPAEKDDLVKRYLHYAKLDRDHPADFSTLNDFTASRTKGKAHQWGTDLVRSADFSGRRTLDNGGGGAETPEQKRARLDARLENTPFGQAILARRKGNARV